MTTTNTPRKRNLTVLRLHLPTHWTKHILRIIQLHTYVVRRSSNPIPDHSNSIYRLCSTMGTIIILRCDCNYKSSISIPIRKKGSCPMSMRRIRSRQCHTYTILCTTLPNSICDRSNSTNSSTIPTPNGIK